MKSLILVTPVDFVIAKVVAVLSVVCWVVDALGSVGRMKDSAVSVWIPLMRTLNSKLVSLSVLP
jgi:hypothetical protein